MDSILDMLDHRASPPFKYISFQETHETFKKLAEENRQHSFKESHSEHEVLPASSTDRDIATDGVDDETDVADEEILFEGLIETADEAVTQTDQPEAPQDLPVALVKDDNSENEESILNSERVVIVKTCDLSEYKIHQPRTPRTEKQSANQARFFFAQETDNKAKGDRLRNIFKHKYTTDSPKKSNPVDEDHVDDFTQHLLLKTLTDSYKKDLEIKPAREPSAGTTINVNSMVTDQSIYDFEIKPSQEPAVRKTINRPITLKVASENVDDDIDVISTSTFSFKSMKNEIDDIDEHDYISRASFAFNVKSSGSPPKALITPGFPENEPFFYQTKRNNRDEIAEKLSAILLKDDVEPTFSSHPLEEKNKTTKTEESYSEKSNPTNDGFQKPFNAFENNFSDDNDDFLQHMRKKRALSVESSAAPEHTIGRPITKRNRRNKVCHGRNKRAQSVNPPIYISDSNKNVAKPSFPEDDPNAFTKKNKPSRNYNPPSKKVHTVDKYGNSRAWKCEFDKGNEETPVRFRCEQSPPSFEHPESTTTSVSTTKQDNCSVSTTKQDNCSQVPFGQRLQNLISRTLILGERSLAGTIFTPQKLAVPRWNTGFFGDSYFSATTAKVPEKEKLIKPAMDMKKPAMEMKKPTSCPVPSDAVKTTSKVKAAKQPSVPAPRELRQALASRCPSNASLLTNSSVGSVQITEKEKQKYRQKMSKISPLRYEVLNKKLSSKSSINQVKNLPCVNPGCPSFQPNKKKISGISKKAPSPSKRMSRIDF